MNAHSAFLKVTGVAFLAIAASFAAAACGDDSGTAVTDAGGTDSTASSSSGSTSGSSSGSSSGGTSGSTSGSSSGSGSTSGSSSGGSSGSSSGSGSGSSGSDAGCAPDGTTYNGCPYPGTVTCLPFNNAEAGVPSPLPTP